LRDRYLHQFRWRSSARSIQRFGIAISGAILLGPATFTWSDPPPPDFSPLILDWLIRNEVVPELPVAPTPHPGADNPANAPIYVDLQQDVISKGIPVTLMLRDDTAPLTGTVDPFALLTYISWSQKVDYVFTDFETEAKFENVLATVAIVKDADEVHVASARHGSYAFYPGPYDPSFAYPGQAFRQEESDFYLASGLSVAMPDAYPYSFHADHLTPAIWGRNIAPNLRSALFWAPLEKVSITKKALPVDHQLVPWVAPFLPGFGFDWVEPPPNEDISMLIKHYRLRGVDGYFVLQSFFPEIYSNDDLRIDLLKAWHSLDWLIAGGETPVILNLETDKVGGLQWSGMATSTSAAIIVSNLGNETAEVSIPLPSGDVVSIVTEAGEHRSLSVGTTGDINFDAVVDGADLGLLLGTWGDCRDCAADLNGDGTVDGADLGVLLGAWTA
jgi:hypothetical protein